MAQTADALEADIAHTRENASATMEAIGDQVSPKHAVNVGKQRLRRWIRSARDGIMGTVSDVEASAGLGTNAAGEAPGVTASQNQGNPLAAGIIAFGVGLLAGSLAPPTKVEQKGLSAIADGAEPAMGAAMQAASEFGHGLQKTTEQAASQLSGVLADAGQQIVDQTKALSVSEEPDRSPGADTRERTD